MSEQLSNNAQTTVVSGLANVTNPVTFVVASAAAFPTSGNFRLLVEGELLLVTAVAGTSLTANRAQEGTAAVSHANGTPVYGVLTAGSLAQYIRDRNAVFNVMDSPYNAIGDGVADDTVAINAAITAAAVNGGTVKIPMPSVAYKITSALVCDDVQGVTLEGVSASEQGGPIIRFTGATGSAISCKSAFGLEIARLTIEYTNAGYAGDLIDCSPSASLGDTAYINIHRCHIVNNGGAIARSGIRLKQAVSIKLEHNRIQGVQVGVRLGDTSYANVVSIHDKNTFVDCSVASIRIDGTVQAVKIAGNTFEPLSGGVATAITQDAAFFAYALMIENNWFGDGTAIGTWVAVRAKGFQFTGNQIYTDPAVTGAGAVLLSILGGSEAVSIVGNNFLQGTTGVTFGATVASAFMAANSFGTVGTTVANLVNVTRLTFLSHPGLEHKFYGPTAAEIGVQTITGGGNAVLRVVDAFGTEVGSTNNVPVGLLTNGTRRLTIDTSGNVTIAGGFLEGFEMTAPSAPAANGGRLYFEDNGSGKTRLMCLFNTGAAQQVAIQP